MLAVAPKIILAASLEAANLARFQQDVIIHPHHSIIAFEQLWPLPVGEMQILKF
jgi:hypothetical protein